MTWGQAAPLWSPKQPKQADSFDPGVGEGAQERESVSVADPAPVFCCQSTKQKRLFEQLSMM